MRILSQKGTTECYEWTASWKVQSVKCILNEIKDEINKPFNLLNTHDNQAIWKWCAFCLRENFTSLSLVNALWRHEMELLSAFLAFCEASNMAFCEASNMAFCEASNMAFCEASNMAFCEASNMAFCEASNMGSNFCLTLT